MSFIQYFRNKTGNINNRVDISTQIGDNIIGTDIKCLRIRNSVDMKRDFYNLLLPRIIHVPENIIQNSVAVSCFPTQINDQNIKTEYINYIRENLNNDTHVYFDNIYEGNVYSCLLGIHDVIKILNLKPHSCTFITGAINARDLYIEWAKTNNIIEMINIVSINSWERHVRYNSPVDLISKNQFIIEKRNKLFLCFNRIARIHRLALLCLLYNASLVDRGFYSFFPNCSYSGSVNTDHDELSKYISTGLFETIVNQYEKQSSNLPLLLNNHDATNTNYVMDSDFDYYKNSYFSLITETFFFSKIHGYYDEHAIFFSEKTFKPIVCKHPFLLASRPKSMHYLRQIGYKTFHPFIDESYDDIEDDEERMLAIMNEMVRLSKKTEDEWLRWMTDVKEIVDFNYNVIMNRKLDDYYIGITKDNGTGEFNEQT